MNVLIKNIMFVFSENKGKAFSTSELVERVFKEDNKRSESLINNEYKDVEKLKEGKRIKAKLHRKLLYHINNLVDEDVLFVSAVTGKGENHYALNPGRNYSSNNNLTKFVERITGLADHDFNLVESFERAGQINKFDSANWYRRLNAVLIENNKSLDELYELINELYLVFNDVIGINNFQNYIAKYDEESMKEFIQKLIRDSEEYRRHITLVLTLKNISKDKLFQFLESFKELSNERINIVVYTDSKEFYEKKTVMKKIMGKNVYFQNCLVAKAPILIGKSGAYSVKESEYEEYLTSLKGNILGILYGTTTITVDYSKTSNKYSEFRKLVMNSARSLLIATSVQRGKSDVFFFNLNKYNGDYQNDFYLFSTNKIRIKGYFNLNEKEEFSGLISGLSEELINFCQVEETIFKSCGIPTRHKVELALNGRVRIKILNRESVLDKKIDWFEKLAELTEHNALLILNLPRNDEEKYLILKDLFESRKIAIYKPDDLNVKENTLENYI